MSIQTMNFRIAVTARATWLGAALAVLASFGPTTVLAEHLYAISPGGKAVYRFPIAPNGLPATTPDSVLYLDRTQDPQGLAVDRVGHIFVADADSATVEEFAPGASGHQKPSATLNLPGDFPDYLKVDAVGRLYVHLAINQDIAIFAKGAHGNDTPISVVPPLYSHELASDYVITNDGKLYLNVFGGSRGGAVLVYDKPLNNPSAPNAFLYPEGGPEFEFWQTIALDRETNHLYIQFLSQGFGYWGKGDFAARELSAPHTRDKLMFTGDCGNESNFTVGGSVIYKRYLTVSCAADGNIYVYRTNIFRKQHAVETVGAGLLTWEIAIGP